MDNKSWTQVHSISLLFTYDIGVQLILYRGVLNQLQIWILRKLVLIWVLMVSVLNLYTMTTQVTRVKLTLGLLLCIMMF